MTEREFSKYKNKMRLGLCCINTELRKCKPPVFCSRTMVRKNFTVKLAKERALENVKDISKMIEWNEKHNIRVFRISSDLFPHYTDTETEKYDMEFAREDLKKAGDLARKYGHRIVMHPGQFVQIGTPNEDVFKHSVDELVYHANILDMMEMGSDSVLIIHGGGTYGNKRETIKRWITRFHTLPDIVKRRVAIENCERQYNIKNVIKLSKRCGIPIIYDAHHHRCYKQLHPEKDLGRIVGVFKYVVESWKDRGNILVHISEQGEGKIGHHSDFIEELSEEFFDVIDRYNVCLDIEVEAKMKEQAIFKLYKKYPEIFN